MKEIKMHTKNANFFYTALSMISLIFLVFAVQKVQGELKTKTITGKVSGKKITFDIYLPESYRKERPGYPVIYNLHGRGGSYKSGGAFHPPHEESNCLGHSTACHCGLPRRHKE